MVTLARQLAALAVGARRAELLAAPPTEAGGAHTGASDGVAQRAVLALAPVAAVGAPVVAVAACKTEDRRAEASPGLAWNGVGPMPEQPPVSAWLLSWWKQQALQPGQLFQPAPSHSSRPRQRTHRCSFKALRSPRPLFLCMETGSQLLSLLFLDGGHSVDPTRPVPSEPGRTLLCDPGPLSPSQPSLAPIPLPVLPAIAGSRLSVFHS